MQTKTILVTGATDGIGKRIALELARQGHAVLVHGRDRCKGIQVLESINRNTCNEKLALYLADFSSLDEIRDMAQDLKREQDSLDVLINNAGNFYRERQLNENGLEMTFVVNYLAPFLLTLLLLDKIKDSAPARIVNVASTTHRNVRKVDFANLQGEKNYNGYDAYALSKLGSILFTNALARRLAGSSVTVNALHPGVIDTKLLRKGWGSAGADVEEGARTSIYLATSPEAEGVSGKYFSRMREQSPSDLAQDEELQEKFWEVSRELVSSYLG